MMTSGWADGVIRGTPTQLGNMTVQMVSRYDRQPLR